MAAGDIRLSNSKVKTWRRCPKKYEFKYVQRLERKTPAIQLKRGSWIHEMLQYHYDGEDWREAHANLTKDFHQLFEEEREEYGDLPGETKRIMQSYLRHWKKTDEGLHVIDCEVDEIITLPTGDKFNFIIDLIVEDRNGLWLWDHKTAEKSFMDEPFMLLDTQLSRYFYCAEKMGYKPLQGVVFNEIRTKAPKVPQLIQDGSRLSRKKIDTDFHTFLAAIRHHDLDPADYSEQLRRLRRNKTRWFRRTTLPKDKPLILQMMRELIMGREEMEEAIARGRFPRSIEKACTYDCEYKDICIADLMGADIKPMIKMNFRRRPKRKDV